MADDGAVVEAGEAAVADEGHLALHPLGDEAVRGLHQLIHAGGALGTLVAEDDDLAGVDLIPHDGLRRQLLPVKDPGAAPELPHILRHAGGAADGALRRQVAPEDPEAGDVAPGLVQGPDDAALGDGDAVQVLAPGIPQEGLFLRAEDALQALHHGRDAAGVVEVDDGIGAAGHHAHKAPHLPGRGVEIVQAQVQAQLMAVGQQVQHGVGGAGDGHVQHGGIQEDILGDDVLGTDAPFHLVHDEAAGLHAAPELEIVRRRDGGGAGQHQVQGLAQDLHGAGGAHGGAGAEGGTDVLLHHVQHLLVAPDGGHVDICLYQGLAMIAARRHDAAGDYDAGNMDPQSGEICSSDDVIAGGQDHKAIQLVDLYHGLDGHGHDIPECQLIAEAVGVRGDVAAGGGDAELHGHAAAHPDALLHGLRQGAEVARAGGALKKRVGDADVGLFDDVLALVARGDVHDPPVGGAGAFPVASFLPHVVHVGHLLFRLGGVPPLSPW